METSLFKLHFCGAQATLKGSEGDVKLLSYFADRLAGCKHLLSLRIRSGAANAIALAVDSCTLLKFIPKGSRFWKSTKCALYSNFDIITD